MKVKEESEKAVLKLSIQKTKIMASGPITSWQIDGETMETVRDFLFGGSKITADVNCSHEIKRCLGKKSYVQPKQHIKKQRHYFANKGPTKVSQSYAFPCGCESWTIKKTEHQRIDAFELWCWRRLLRVPWTAKRSNQSILKEISPWIFIGRVDAQAETRKLWRPDPKNWLTEKDPDAGKDWRQEEKGTTEDEMVGWHHQLNGHDLSKLQELVMDREAWHAAVHEVWTWLSDWSYTHIYA